MLQNRHLVFRQQSGSGKTTMLNIIGSLDIPSAGEVTVLNHSIGSLTQKEAANLRKKSLGFIFQSYNLFGVHNVFENIEFPLLLLDYTAAERKKMVMEALNREFKTTFLFATHDDKVISYLRRKIFLDDGRIVNDELTGN
jgi:ABC-type lipoprotein export system ATPase subunit